MITPVTFIVAIDGSTKLREHTSNVSQLLESALIGLMTNDDLGFVMSTDVTQAVFPLIILRPQNQRTIKQELLQELAAAQDATTRGRPTKPLVHALDLLRKRSKQDQWRPVCILLITDGRPDDEDLVQLSDLVKKLNAERSVPSSLGPIFLDAYIFNKHHPKRDFAEALAALGETDTFCATSVIRVRSRIDIVKGLWNFRDRVRQARDSIQASDVSASVAKRRAPGHVRIPSMFKK